MSLVVALQGALYVCELAGYQSAAITIYTRVVVGCGMQWFAACGSLRRSLSLCELSLLLSLLLCLLFIDRTLKSVARLSYSRVKSVGWHTSITPNY